MSDAMKVTQASLVNLPWTQDPNTVALNQTLGEEKDLNIDRARAAVKLRWPGGDGMRQAEANGGVQEPVPSAVGDAERIRLILSGFGLERLGAMTDAQAEAYAESAWAVHGQGGTIASIEDALHSYGIPDVEVVEEWMAPTETWANPGGYGWRICVILGPNFGTLGWTPQGFPLPLDGSSVLGIAGMTPMQLADVAHLIRRWKTAASLPVRVVFRFGSAAVFGTGGCAFPISLDGPDISFLLTGPFFSEDGIPLPMTFGPFYIYG